MEQTTAALEADASEPPAQGPVLLHIRMVDAAKADDHVRSLSELFARVAGQPEVRDILRHLRGAANLVVRLYHVTATPGTS